MNALHPLDLKATGLAKDYLRTEAELLNVLMEMRRRRLFAELNFSGVFDYCERRLNLSRMQSFYFKSVAEKAEQVPELKAAVTSGELTLSQARRIVPVIDKENCAEWVAKAKTLPQRELEREVTSINPNAHIPERIKPVAKEISELRVAVDFKTEANLNALKEILSQRLGKAATLADVVAWAAETTREKFDPLRKAERSRAKSEKASKATPAATPKNESPSRRPPGPSPTRPGEPAVNIPREHFLRKSEPMSMQQPGRTPIPASVKHEVFLRDRGRCTHIGPNGHRCRQTRWLDQHHIVEVHRGGQNTPENLRLLCHAHHAQNHRFSPGKAL